MLVHCFVPDIRLMELKVIDNAVANCRSGSSRVMSLLSQKNCQFMRLRGFICQVPVTWMYLHEFMAKKKKMPMARLAAVFSAGDKKGSWA
jgi:hypothetical protein